MWKELDENENENDKKATTTIYEKHTEFKKDKTFIVCCWSCYSVVISSIRILTKRKNKKKNKKNDSPSLKNNPFYTQKPNQTNRKKA